MKILAAILPTKPRTENTAFTGFHSNSLYILQVDVIQFITNCKFYSICTVKNWLMFEDRPTKLGCSSGLFFFIVYTFTISVKTHQIFMFLSVLITIIFTVYRNFYGNLLAELLPGFHCKIYIFFTVYYDMRIGLRELSYSASGIFDNQAYRGFHQGFLKSSFRAQLLW